jgi:hypothetical protein
LFVGNFRLVVRFRVYFLKFLVVTAREGHWEMESKRPDAIKTICTGKTHREG